MRCVRVLIPSPTTLLSTLVVRSTLYVVRIPQYHVVLSSPMVPSFAPSNVPSITPSVPHLLIYQALDRLLYNLIFLVKCQAICHPLLQLMRLVKHHLIYPAYNQALDRLHHTHPQKLSHWLLCQLVCLALGLQWDLECVVYESIEWFAKHWTDCSVICGAEH